MRKRGESEAHSGKGKSKQCRGGSRILAGFHLCILIEMLAKSEDS